MDTTSMPLFSFARKLGVSRRTVTRWVNVGLHGGAVKLPVRRIGARLAFISWSDYEDFQRRVDSWRRAPLPIETARERRAAAADDQRWLAEYLA